jgi:MSHA pilin protein MshD
MHVTKQLGFTLIELVMGIVVFSIALVLFTSLIVPQAIRSVDPIFQVRAAELGQSLIKEITSRAFDEASTLTVGATLCSPAVAPLCTQSGSLGNDEADRANYADVDDYDGLTEPDVNGEINNALNQAIQINNTGIYSGFSLQVSIFYDDNMDGIDDAIAGGSSYIGNVKFVKVTVTTPNNENLIFSTFRSNY